MKVIQRKQTNNKSSREVVRMMAKDSMRRRIMRGNALRLAFVLAIASLAIPSLIALQIANSNDDADALSAVYSVNVPGTPVLKMEIDNAAIALDMNPTMVNADFQVGSYAITVGTSNEKGYTLSLIPGSTALTSASGATIDSLTTDTSLCPDGYTNESSSIVANSVCEFTVNRWGWKKSTDSFYGAIPTEEIILATNDVPTDGVTTTLNFATKVDSHLEAGTYDAVLNFVAVVNNSATIDSLTNMQDFVALSADDIESVKDSMTVNESYQLTDARDSNKYWVTKLETDCSNPRVDASSDGKCYQIWMTQNLNLDLTTSTPLTSENTDLNDATGIYSSGYTNSNNIISWTPTRATVTSISSTANDNNTPYSSNQNANTFYYPGATSGTNGSAPAACTADSEVCNHWKGGVLYNWSAAVASNNTANQTADGTEAKNSICPAGWRLPSGITTAAGAQDGNAGSSDLGYLLVKQGITSAYGTAGQNTGWNTNGYLNIQSAPLYITRSGYFIGGSFDYGSANGNLWSSTTNSSSDAYNLTYNSGGVYPAGNNGRVLGFSVRCLARE